MKKILVCLSLLSLFSCSKDDDNSDSPVKITAENLLGKWIYESDLHTPALNEHPNDLSEIDCYTNNTYYEFYINDIGHISARYHLGEENCITGEPIVQEIHIDSEYSLKIDDGEPIGHPRVRGALFVTKQITSLSQKKMTLELATIKTNKIDQNGNHVYEDPDNDGTFDPVFNEIASPVERLETLIRL